MGRISYALDSRTGGLRVHMTTTGKNGRIHRQGLRVSGKKIKFGGKSAEILGPDGTFIKIGREKVQKKPTEKLNQERRRLAQERIGHTTDARIKLQKKDELTASESLKLRALQLLEEGYKDIIVKKRPISTLARDGMLAYLMKGEVTDKYGNVIVKIERG